MAQEEVQFQQAVLLDLSFTPLLFELRIKLSNSERFIDPKPVSFIIYCGCKGVHVFEDVRITIIVLSVIVINMQSSPSGLVRKSADPFFPINNLIV